MTIIKKEIILSNIFNEIKLFNYAKIKKQKILFYN